MSSTISDIIRFRVGNLACALPLDCIQEIIRDGKGVAPVPLAPPPLCGVLNLRGSILSVIDLGLLFAQSESDEKSLIIVRQQDQVLALAVTRVLDVIQNQKFNLENKLKLPEGLTENQVKGILDCNNELTALLEITAISMLEPKGDEVS